MAEDFEFRHSLSCKETAALETCLEAALQGITDAAGRDLSEQRIAALQRATEAVVRARFILTRSDIGCPNDGVGCLR